MNSCIQKHYNIEMKKKKAQAQDFLHFFWFQKVINKTTSIWSSSISNSGNFSLIIYLFFLWPLFLFSFVYIILFTISNLDCILESLNRWCYPLVSFQSQFYFSSAFDTLPIYLCNQFGDKKFPSVCTVQAVC